jgi:hypothetical protein
VGFSAWGRGLGLGRAGRRHLSGEGWQELRDCQRDGCGYDLLYEHADGRRRLVKSRARLRRAPLVVRLRPCRHSPVGGGILKTRGPGSSGVGIPSSRRVEGVK